MKIALCALGIFACVCGQALAQQPNPVANALRADQTRYEKNLVGAAEAMPADKYGSKPTPAQMSFGELVLHVARSNNVLCSSISGQAAPSGEPPAASAGKEGVVAYLKQSFGFCRTALSGLDDSKLGEEVPFFGGRKITRAQAVLGLAVDWGDHYSLAATELRMAGLTPPSAQRASR